MLFTNEENPGEAVSAVKALTIASNEGQRIYQVTQENVNAVLPVLNISTEVKDEIRDSVAVGKKATVSQNNITVGGWTGVGYIIADPDTGAGAYRISGGSNGGFYLLLGVALLAIGGLIAVFFPAILGLGSYLFGIGIIMTTFSGSLDNFNDSANGMGAILTILMEVIAATYLHSSITTLSITALTPVAVIALKLFLLAVLVSLLWLFIVELAASTTSSAQYNHYSPYSKLSKCRVKTPVFQTGKFHFYALG